MRGRKKGNRKICWHTHIYMNYTFAYMLDKLLLTFSLVRNDFILGMQHLLHLLMQCPILEDDSRYIDISSSQPLVKSSQALESTNSLKAVDSAGE